MPICGDLPLQVLETLGVCVAAYNTDEFPAFFSASSGCEAPARVDNAAQAAALVRGVQQLDLGSGVIIGQTPPCCILAVAKLSWHLCGQAECIAVAVDMML